MLTKAEMVCELCERQQKLTFHHLIPKKNHKIKYIQKRFSAIDLNKYGIMICNDCHKMIHKLIPHKQLALEFNTTEKLISHKELAKFICWVKSQTKKVK